MYIYIYMYYMYIYIYSLLSSIFSKNINQYQAPILETIIFQMGMILSAQWMILRIDPPR